MNIWKKTPDFKPSNEDLQDLKELKESLANEKENACRYYAEVYWSLIRLKNNLSTSEGIQYKINQFLIHIETKNKNGWEKIMTSYETIFEKIFQIEGASN